MTHEIQSRGSRFLIFGDFQYLTIEFGLAKESSEQLEKRFFFIFMSSHEHIVLRPKMWKKSQK
jgi:hypothetical protein